MSDDVRYRWSRAFGLRFLAATAVVLAVLWVLAALVGFAWWSLVLVGVGAVVMVGCLLRFVLVPPLLLEVSAHGYRLRNVRGAGVTRAAWSEVDSVAGGAGVEGAVMLVTLTDGRSTTVPLVLLGHRAVEAERDMHRRLNSAFGYRRLRES